MLRNRSLSTHEEGALPLGAETSAVQPFCHSVTGLEAPLPPQDQAAISQDKDLT